MSQAGGHTMWSRSLDTLIGIVAVIVLTSLLCSAVTEGISQVFTKRAKDLLRGIADMLDPAVHKQGTLQRAKALSDSTLKSLPAAPATEVGTLALYQQPLIRALQTPRGLPWSSWRRNPQYVPARTFARALISLMAPVGSRDGQHLDPIDSIHASLQSLDEDHPARRALEPLLVQADRDLDSFRTMIEEWYDAQMARLGGAYKRWSQVVLAGVGLAVAAGFNIDLLAVGETLWTDEAIRTVVVENAVDGTLCEGTTGDERLACVDDELDALGSAGIPLGWQSDKARPWEEGGSWWPSAIGWLLTAGAVSFGAPFWFDTLSKLGNLRSAGPKEPDAADATA